MRVLLDENLDRRLKRAFDNAFEIVTVTERGWSGLHISLPLTFQHYLIRNTEPKKHPTKRIGIF